MKKTTLVLIAMMMAAYAQSRPQIIVGHDGGTVPIAFENEKGVWKDHANWIGKNADKMLICELPDSDQYREGKFSFTPKADGRIRLEFKACDSKVNGKKVAQSCYYDNIRINGQLIPNGDFESGEQGFVFYRVPSAKELHGRVVTAPGAAKAGKGCVMVWDHGPMSFTIDGKKDQPVTVSFDYRDAGIMTPDMK